MQLSDAIRRGVEISPRQAKDYFSDDEGGTCVMGAAMEGMLGRKVADAEFPILAWGAKLTFVDLMFGERADYTGEVFDRFPILREEVAPPDGVEGLDPDRLYDLAADLNNDFGWSREQIADWIEQKEIELGYREVDISKLPVMEEEVAYATV